MSYLSYRFIMIGPLVGLPLQCWQWSEPSQWISEDSMTKNCCVSNSFSLKLRDFWERIHKFRVNCLRDAMYVVFAHSLLTRYFSSAWSISFSLILLVSSQIFTLLQAGKFLRENWAGNISINCSILTPSSWRHLGRYFRHHVSLDLFVDFVPFSE